MKVSVGTSYIDKDEREKKGRDLDIKVRIPIRYKVIKRGKLSSRPGIFVNLLIQCKSIPGNAWVFFKVPQEISAVPQATSLLDSLNWIPREHIDFLFLPGLHYESAQKATLCHEYILDEKRSNNKKDNLFREKVSLAKATSYELETTVQSMKDFIDKWTKIPEHAPLSAELYYPILVFDGNMYFAEKSNEHGEMNPIPIDHVGLCFYYLSGSYDIDLYIDIVERQAFPDFFFDNIAKDIKILKKAVEDEVGIHFRKTAEKALGWYLSKKKLRYK